MTADQKIPKILIVDDRPENLFAMKHVLSGLDAELFTADSGNAALALTIHHEFAIVLLDVQMPDMDGYEVATFLREREETARVPIIFVTAINKEKAHVFKGYDTGAVDYLFKPIESDILQAKVGVFLELYRQRKELTEKNNRLAELYEKAHQSVDNVSHEFRTPLTVIREYATIIRDGLAGPVTDQQREFLNIISDRTDDLANMVDDMLDVSKLEAGLLSAWRRETPLLDVLNRVRPALQQKATIKHVSLEFDLDDDLPTVYCDPEKIGRVIINLAINAIKFCGQGGCVKIWGRYVPERSEILVGITDDGPGITKENLKLIFDRFQQVEGTTKSSTKGFGLGLNIAKELVGLNFGQMNVESELGTGSTFSFSIPLWEPFELAARHLDRVKGRVDSTSNVGLIVATTAPNIESSVSNVVDEFLQYALRSGDVVMQVSPHKWLVLVDCSNSDIDTIVDRLRAAWNEANRSRPGGYQMPEIMLKTKGVWEIATNTEDILYNFSCELPATEDKPDSPHAYTHENNGPSSHGVISGDGNEKKLAARVLAVDDDEELLRGLTVRLQAAGHEVLTASDGRAAVDSALKHHPDAILMDNYMPKMNGVDALIDLGTNPDTKDIPVIMLSASLRDRDKALDRGVRFFFQKPSPPETILAALDDVLGQSVTVGVE